jgi:hypothetical protein
LGRGTGSCTITSPTITSSSTIGSSTITNLFITGSHHTTGSCITTGSQCVDAASPGVTEAKRGGNTSFVAVLAAAARLPRHVPSTLIARADEVIE